MRRKLLWAVIVGVAVALVGASTVVAINSSNRAAKGVIAPSRSEFAKSVKGLTQDEVRMAYGSPLRVLEGFPGDEAWAYRDGTGEGDKESRLVVVFTNYKAVAVRVEE